MTALAFGTIIAALYAACAWNRSGGLLVGMMNGVVVAGTLSYLGL